MTIQQAQDNVDYIKGKLGEVEQQQESLYEENKRLMIELGNAYKDLRELE